MKLSNVLVAAVMAISTVGAAGCSTSQVEGATEVAQAAGQPSEAASFFGSRGSVGRFGFGERAHLATPFVRERLGFSYRPMFVGYAPPAARYEAIGRAPSSLHIWSIGYQRWTGRDYVWSGGHWMVRRPGAVYVQPHYDTVGGRWVFVPGHWA